MSQNLHQNLHQNLTQNQREFFRFSFMEPAQFRVLTKSGSSSSWGECYVVNMSAGGAKVISTFDLPVDNPNYTTEIEIRLSEQRFFLEADLLWKQNTVRADRWAYGLRWLHLHEKTRDELFKALVRRETNQRKTGFQKK